MGQKNIGLIGPRELATAFSAVGYRVIGGATFQDAAKNIRTEFEQSGKMPDLIVVVDEQAAGIGPWVESQAMRTEVRIIPSAQGVFDGHGLSVSIPTTLADLLAGVGLDATGPGASTLIGFGGIVTSSIAPEAKAVELRARETQPAPAAVQIPAPMFEAVAPARVEAAEAPAELETVPLGDPDFVPSPIPTLDDEDVETPTPDRATESAFVPTNDSVSPVGGGSQPTWLNQNTDHGKAEPKQAPDRANPVAPETPQWAAAPTQPAHSIPARAVPPALDQAYLPPQPDVQASLEVQPDTHISPWPPQVQAQQVSAPIPQPQQVSIADFRDQRSQFVRHQAQAAREAELLISWAGKGGVGKSSLSLAIAQTAGEAGLRVLLADANRGQSSIRHTLKVAREQFPSVYDVRHVGAHGSVVSKDQINQRRIAARGAIHFDVLLAPPEDFAGPVHTPASVYMQAVSELRREYDLIVIDTQILEAEGDMTDMWHELLVPLLRGGAWGLGSFDESAEGLDLLDERISMLTGRFGISNARMLVVASKWEQFTDDDAAVISQLFVGRASFLGSSDQDASFHDQLGTGFIFTAATGIAPVVRHLLHTVTGRTEFTPATSQVGGRKPFRLFGRKSK